MVRWRISDGPSAVPDTKFTDGDIWGATLEKVDDPEQRRLIQVVIARSVLQSRPEGLLGAVRDAIESNGKTAIEQFLGDEEPPARIVVGSGGVHIAESE